VTDGIPGGQALICAGRRCLWPWASITKL